MAQIKTNLQYGTTGTVQSANVADDAITLGKMASGTDGNVITYDASGNPAVVASGTSGHFLKSQGAGTVPVFASSGKVLQVLQAVKTDTFTSSATSYTDLTGITLAITPSATSSKILVMTQLSMAVDNGGQPALKLLRDSTALNLGAAASSRTRATTTFFTEATWESMPVSIIYLDSPSSTSALTYKVQGFGNGGNVIYVNRSASDSDASNYYRSSSSIILMEIGA